MSILAYVIVMFAGWTLAANCIVIAGGSLNTLMVWGPMASITAACLLRLGTHSASVHTSDHRGSASLGGPQPPSIAWQVTIAVAVTATLAISWPFFWCCSVVFLTSQVWTSRRLPVVDIEPATSRTRRWWLPGLCFANALLTLATNRPDADDAFYVGLSAFASSHPAEPLLAFDPMVVERSWPLIFPSYRFGSYELLVAATAHASSLPAMIVAHVAFPPFAAAFAVLAVYFLARELRVGSAIAIAFITMAFTLAFGETPRSPANFAFVRLFQGKAIMLWVMIPCIYAFTLRHARQHQGKGNLWLLACTYVAAIGTSNFGMLIAPMAGVTAAISAGLGSRAAFARSAQAAACSLIAVPYLLCVAVSSHVGATFDGTPSETAGSAWASSFGTYSQYPLAFLILVAPVLAPGRRGTIITAIPPLLMLGFALNPLLAPYIGRYLTTPPVYWRVTWQAPVFVLAAAGLYLLGMQLRRRDIQPRHHLVPAIAMLGVACAFVGLARFNTLRPANDVDWAFGRPKVNVEDAKAADSAIRHAPAGARILAPDAVSSVIAMAEHHPLLVFARAGYLFMLRGSVPGGDYAARMRLATWINNPSTPPPTDLSPDLRALDVAVIVVPGESSQRLPRELGDYKRVDSTRAYAIWVLNEPTKP